MRRQGSGNYATGEGAGRPPGQGTQSGPATSVLWQVEFGGHVLAPASTGVTTPAASVSLASAAGAAPESTAPASASVQAGLHVPGTPMFWAVTVTETGAPVDELKIRGFG